MKKKENRAVFSLWMIFLALLLLLGTALLILGIRAGPMYLPGAASI